MTFEEILRPMNVETFRQSYLGREYAVIRGARQRFMNVAPWSRINEALATVRLESGRVSLVKNGEAVPEDTFSFAGIKGRRYIDGDELARCLASGATLVMTQVDELWPEARSLAESCEAIVNTRVNLNLYAGWGVDRGFVTHWDPHDTLILQIVGRKQWTVWAPTEPDPLPGDVVPEPTVPPVWEGTLEDGDVLYMPRGWWHVAYPINEASVHLTAGISHPLGSDLVAWALAKVPESRMPVPHWHQPTAKQAWLEALRQRILSVLSEDVVERYRETLEDKARARPSVHLPGAVRQHPDIADDTPLRLRLGSRLHLHRVDGDHLIAFVSQGRNWSCSEAIAPALRLLNNVNACTLAQMKAVVSEGGRPLLRPFVQALVAARVVSAEPTGRQA